jgi:hypothetical protein
MGGVDRLRIRGLVATWSDPTGSPRTRTEIGQQPTVAAVAAASDIAAATLDPLTAKRRVPRVLENLR